MDSPLFWIAITYGAMSVVSVVVYAWDKSAAIEGGQRISEDSLHLISVLGGWPGALVAQQLWRHKTKKRAFRAVFWTTVVVNAAVVSWLAANSSSPLIGEH